VAKWIEFLFGVKTPGGPNNVVLDGGHRAPNPQWHGEGGVHSMQPLPNYFGLLLCMSIVSK